MRIPRVTIGLSSIMMAMLLLAPVSSEAQKLEKAPPNPAFLKERAPGEVNFGYRPSPVQRSRVKPLRAIKSPLRALPATYDLRSLGKVTSVKNQNPYGTCWAHATCASMESALLVGENRDFSENNMANHHGGDWGFDDGGTSQVILQNPTKDPGGLTGDLVIDNGVGMDTEADPTP